MLGGDGCGARYPACQLDLLMGGMRMRRRGVSRWEGVWVE